MKKIMMILLVLALLVSVTACSFGRDDTGKDSDSDQNVEDLVDREDEEKDNDSQPVEEDSATEEPTTEEPTTEEPTTEEPTTEEPTVAEPALSKDEQLAFIAANYELWVSDEDMLYPTLNYTVSDLDQNGRWELLIGITIGSGSFTYANLWEMNEDCTALVKTNNFEEGYSQSDFFADEADVFYDEGSDTFFYIVDDYSRGGWAWNGTERRAMWLKNGVLSERALAYRSCETNSEDYTSVTTYTDDDGNEITEEEYEAIPEKVFASLQKMRATFLWQNISKDEPQNVEELTGKLQDAAAAFLLS